MGYSVPNLWQRADSDCEASSAFGLELIVVLLVAGLSRKRHKITPITKSQRP
jgi:hypothetical protein